jgi:SpoIID/LytB domain protein
MRRRVACLLALAGLALAAPAAQAEYRIAGHGFGHGVGLAQYGAMGYASQTNHTYTWILRQYYPGTSSSGGHVGRLRVRLAQTATARVSLATLAVGVGGRQISLSSGTVYRFDPWTTDGLAIVNTATGSVRAHLHAPVRLTGGSSLRLLGPAESGVTDGRYRDALVLHRAGSQVLVVNDIGLERYLYGVVPAEMPSAWPAEALRSQAVVARSYALTSLKPTAIFDVFADTRSQAYRGVVGEAASTTAAVRATSGIVVMYGSAIARTLFHSSSGGVTAAAEEVFGSPVPYLRSVPDPYDTVSPYHNWSVTLTDAEAQRRLATVISGNLVSIVVTARTPTGRAATVRVTSTGATRDITGATARSLLGLRSTWFSVAHA